jgi:hypothetical protein
MRDGGNYTVPAAGAEHGISGCRVPMDALVGVFLGHERPTP